MGDCDDRKKMITRMAGITGMQVWMTGLTGVTRIAVMTKTKRLTGMTRMAGMTWMAGMMGMQAWMTGLT